LILKRYDRLETLVKLMMDVNLAFPQKYVEVDELAVFID